MLVAQQSTVQLTRRHLACGCSAVDRMVSPQSTTLQPLYLHAAQCSHPALSASLHRARQHVPVDEYSSNLRAMVAHLRSMGVPAVILITPPPISEADRLVHVEQVGLLAIVVVVVVWLGVWQMGVGCGR